MPEHLPDGFSLDGPDPERHGLATPGLVKFADEVMLDAQFLESGRESLKLLGAWRGEHHRKGVGREVARGRLDGRVDELRTGSSRGDVVSDDAVVGQGVRRNA